MASGCLSGQTNEQEEFVLWGWHLPDMTLILEMTKKKEKKETKPIPFNCLSKAGRFCHSNLMFQETQQ